MPWYTETLLKLSSKEVDSLHSTDDAFELLLGPLKDANSPVVFLIDALDEADPPEQQMPDFEGCIKACGNVVLSVIIKLLARQLPECMRFIITTRPDAVCGDVEKVLARNFTSIKFLRPRDVRDDSDSNTSGGDGRVLVFDAVIKGCNLPPLPPGSIAALPQLYAAYEAVFDRAPMIGPSAELLQVLLAAQEPLPISFLQRMGFDETVLKALPGWGTLFYEAEHHVGLGNHYDWLRHISLVPQHVGG